MPLTARLRRLFPPSGQQYELFDNAVFVAAIVFVRYVLEGPSENQERGLALLASAASLDIWGAVITAAAVTAAVCSYRHDWLRAGYSVLVAALALWVTAFLIGLAFYGAPSVTVVSALIYFWVISRLIRDGILNGRGRCR